MSVIELVPNKQSFLLNIDGFFYYKHTSKNNCILWKCRQKPICYASVTTTTLDADVQIIRGGPEVSSHNVSPMHRDLSVNPKSIKDLGEIVAKYRRTFIN